MVSLFSGCGGLDLGLHQAGFETVFATDQDTQCKLSYEANLPEVPFWQGNVKDVDCGLIGSLSNITLLAGGPPCPPFSKSRFYRKEKKRALDDPNGELTIASYLRILESLTPEMFLLENVAGLAYRVHHEALDYIIRSAADLGYIVNCKVLNAANYGVPQLRERCFVVGTRRKAFEFPSPTHRDPGKGVELFSESMPSWVTAGMVLEDLDTEENADDAGHFAGGKYHHLLCELPEGENYLYFTKERGYPDPVFKWRSRYWSFLLKLSHEMPSWTIQARRSNNMGPFHWRNRILRIAEVKRLQTFPDDWILEGTVEQQWRQIGNAVPPLLAKHIGAALLKHWRNFEAVHIEDVSTTKR